MIKKIDPRHQNRISLFQDLYSWDLRQKTTNKIAPIIAKIAEIDKLITIHASKWPINQINKIDLSTLRLAIFEMNFTPSPPPVKVIINEAIEIAKEFGTDTSGSFVNAVLGSIIKHDQK